MALTGAACAPEPRRVYVDLDAVTAMEAQAAFPVVAVPAPPSALPKFVGVLPALPELTVSLPVTSKRIEDARQAIKKNEADAFEALEIQLRDIKVAAVLRKKAEREAALNPLLAEVRKESLRKAAAAFADSAAKRGPALTRLTLLVGFPDPDPYSIRDAEPTRRRGIRRYEVAKTWREIIRTIDADYDEEVSEFDKEATSRYLKALTQVFDEMDEAKQKAEEEARQEARAQRSKTNASFESLIAGGSEARIGSVPGRSTTISSGPNPAPAPRARRQAVDSRAQIETDLQIWLASRRYVLVRTRGAARDVTQEFMTWRKEQLAGR